MVEQSTPDRCPTTAQAASAWHSCVEYLSASSWRLWADGRPSLNIQELVRSDGYPRVSYLAMYLQTGEGFTFSRTAIDRVVPQGAAVYTEARSSKHLAISQRAGLRPLPGPGGEPTLAMGVETA